MARPRSPNPTEVISTRVPGPFMALIDALAADKGIKRSTMAGLLLVSGYNVERVKEDEKHQKESVTGSF